jgi:hypothetical protein
VAFVTALLTGIYQAFQTGAALNWITLKPVLFTAIAAGLSYIIKNYLTNSEGQLMKTEKYGAKHPVKSGGSYRTILIIAMLSCFGIAAHAQSIFKPVPKTLFTENKDMSIKASLSPSVWLWRFSAGVIATQWTVENKQVKQEAFNKTGMGLSYAHYIDQDGLPYNNVSVNGFLFFPVDGSAKVTIAGTVSFLKYIQVGLDYDAGLNKLGVLTGISYTF